MIYVLGFIVGLAIFIVGITAHVVHKIEIPAYLVMIVGCLVAGYCGFVIKAYMYAHIFKTVLN